MWQMTTARVRSESGEMFESYGIKINSTVIDDISLDKEETEKFVELLNRLGASELHAYDLVEDFLGR
ncbi:MAG: hypothetical protein K2N06_10550 [Oscillospiraceae bacterium]|nr:hypothetical protein [Oscillospiraceae bacterium]